MKILRLIILLLHIFTHTLNITNRKTPQDRLIQNRPFTFNNKSAPTIQDTSIDSTPICSDIISTTKAAVLDQTGNLVNAPFLGNEIWEIIWNNIKHNTSTADVLPYLSLASVGGDLALTQRFGGVAGNVNHSASVSSTYVEYTLEQAFFNGSPLVPRDVCRIKITDPDLTAVLYDIFTLYNSGTPEWFFCSELSINFFITPNDFTNYGSDELKFHFEVRFEDDCKENGPLALDEPVFKVENLRWIPTNLI